MSHRPQINSWAWIFWIANAIRENSWTPIN